MWSGIGVWVGHRIGGVNGNRWALIGWGIYVNPEFGSSDVGTGRVLVWNCFSWAALSPKFAQNCLKTARCWKKILGAGRALAPRAPPGSAGGLHHWCGKWVGVEDVWIGELWLADAPESRVGSSSCCCPRRLAYTARSLQAAVPGGPCYSAYNTSLAPTRTYRWVPVNSKFKYRVIFFWMNRISN